MIAKPKLATRRPKQPKTRMPRSSIMTKSLPYNKYRIALTDPFDDRAKDVRLPNDFAVPTITRTITGYCTLGSGLKPAAYLFPPSPCVSLYSPSGTLPQTDFIPYNNFNQVYQAIDQERLRSNFVSWRLVAGGIRIKSAASSTATPVVVSIATAPVVGSGPGPTFLNDGAVQTEAGLCSILADIIGVSPSLSSSGIGGWGSQINAFSNFNRFTTQDVTTQTLTVPFRVSDARAFDFKSSQSNTGRGYGSNTVMADSVVFDATTGLIKTGIVDNEENYQFEGFSAIALEVKNSSSVIANVLEIEYIYHLEGIATSSANTTRNAISSGTSTSEAVTHLGDVAWANRQGLYKIATAMTGTLFNRTPPDLVAQMLGLRF